MLEIVRIVRAVSNRRILQHIAFVHNDFELVAQFRQLCRHRFGFENLCVRGSRRANTDDLQFVRRRNRQGQRQNQRQSQSKELLHCKHSFHFRETYLFKHHTGE